MVLALFAPTLIQPIGEDSFNMLTLKFFTLFLGYFQNGESWKMSNCTNATCIDGKVIEKPAVCPTVLPLICANGRPAVKVYDDDGCCFHYECQCKSGFGCCECFLSKMKVRPPDYIYVINSTPYMSYIIILFVF